MECAFRLSSACTAIMPHSEKKRHSGRFAGHDLDKRGSEPTPIGQSINLWLSRHGHDRNGRDLLCELWKNWPIVMGDEIAAMAYPLGSRGDVLIIGGDDNYILQDLSYYVDEILMRANAFMQVEFNLLMGQHDLRSVDTTIIPKAPPPQKPENLGTLRIPQGSPAAAAYEAYVRLFKG